MNILITLAKASIAVLVTVSCFISSLILIMGFKCFNKVNSEVDKAIKTGNFHVVKEERKEKEENKNE